jgi:hypothetical protein
MRVVEVRFLAVLDAIEAFLLDGTDKLAVDEQRGRRLVIHAIDSKNVQWSTSPREKFTPTHRNGANQSIGPRFRLLAGPPDMLASSQRQKSNLRPAGGRKVMSSLDRCARAHGRTVLR